MAGINGRTAYGGYPYGYYPQQYVPGMNGYQMPGVQQPVQPGTVQPNPQMTKPTVHADIVQIENEAAGENEPVDAGTSQMMITKDEMVIMIKSVLANGETTMDIYRKQPKAEKPAEPEYVTRVEFEKRIAEMIRETAEPIRPVLRVVEPESAEDNEPEYEAPVPRPVQRTRSANGGKRQ
jgi:hypothetical protein